jgi:hypothetical protein
MTINIILLSFPLWPERLRMPQNPQQTITEDFFPGKGGGVVILSTNLYLVSMVRLHWTLPLLRYAYKWRVPSARGTPTPLLAKAYEFVIYETIFSVAQQTAGRRTIRLLVKVNWKERGRMLQWLNLRFYPGIWPDRPREKPRKPLLSATSLGAEIWSWGLPNTRKENSTPDGDVQFLPFVSVSNHYCSVLQSAWRSTLYVQWLYLLQVIKNLLMSDRKQNKCLELCCLL